MCKGLECNYIHSVNIVVKRMSTFAKGTKCDKVNRSEVMSQIFFRSMLVGCGCNLTRTS